MIIVKNDVVRLLLVLLTVVTAVSGAVVAQQQHFNWCCCSALQMVSNPLPDVVVAVDCTSDNVVVVYCTSNGIKIVWVAVAVAVVGVVSCLWYCHCRYYCSWLCTANGLKV